MERTNRRFFAINRVNDFGGLVLNLASQKQQRNCCLARKAGRTPETGTAVSLTYPEKTGLY
jgi:hypothetical protein